MHRSHIIFNPKTRLEHGDQGTNSSAEGNGVDFDAAPRKLSDILCETGDAFRLRLSQASLRQLGSTSRDNDKSAAAAADVDDMKTRHLRLARLLNEEDRCWDFIYNSMDSYMQRMGSSSKMIEPCEEYTLLNERGPQMLLAFKRHITKF